VLRSPWRFQRTPSRVELVALAGVAVALLTVGVARPAAVVARKRAATARLTFVDKTSDHVNTGTTIPDRRPDGHFRLEVVGDGTITGLTLRTADASGKACCSQVWNTVTKDSFWILGVFREGKSLNPADQAVSIPFTGSVTLDLYGSDSGWFKLGQHFRIDATLADGGTVSAVAPAITSLGGTGGGGTGGGGGGGTTTTTTTTPAGTAAAPPTATATGTVTVNGVPFTAGTIPFNATVDVTKGRIVLTSNVGTLTVTGAGGITAAFKLLRGTDKGKPIVELRLVKGNFGSCKKPRSRAPARAAAKTVRQLWGDGKGSFRTRGRYAAATVRGTKWLTADRCDGTLTRVVRGVVTVADLPKKKQVTVLAGKRYLAEP
jgi:hypothetical protein